MQSLQNYTEEAENLLYHARRCIPNFSNNLVSNGRPVINLYQKLAEIRKEELRSTFSLVDPSIEQNHIQLTDSRLIEKLVKRDHLNTLIFNLYPANRGYTLAVIVRSIDNPEKILTSMRLPYTEEQLFSYIDNEEIPPLLCDVIDNCVVKLYYGGCIVAEIRDYRKSTTSSNYVKQHVLLHQSMQTILNDVNEAICNDDNIDDKLSSKLEMEKTLLLANYGPLCLNPRPSIAIANQKLHYSKHFLNTHKLKFKARKHTLLGIAQRKRQQLHSKCAPFISSLVDFISKKKASQESKSEVPKKHLPECAVSDDFWTEAAKSVLEFVKPIERPLEIKDLLFNSKLVEEYSIETRDDAGLQFMIKLTISQRNADYEYIGEIFQSRELNTGGFHNITYSFPLGTRELATRYVLEFTNVYTERGKIRVNFSHKIPGKPPEVCITSGLRMEGNKLVPVEAKSLGLDTLIPLEALKLSKTDPKARNVISVSKARTSINNVSTAIGNDSDKVVLTSQNVLQNIQQHFQQQILQPKKKDSNPNLQQQMNAIVNFKAQIQEHIQMRQTNSVSGLVSHTVPHFTSLLKKENIVASVSSTQATSVQRTLTTVMPKSNNTSLQYQCVDDETRALLTNPSNIATVNGNNSTILSLLANTNAQSSSSALTNITLSSLLTSSTMAQTSPHTVNISGQRVLAKRVKMQGAPRIIASNQQVTTSLANATVIAASASNVTGINPALNAQPVIRLSLSSLPHQASPVIQQRGGKNIPGRIIAPGNLKAATSLVNSIQPVTVTSTGNLQIGTNTVHSLSAVQSLLNSGAITQTATGLRMKATNARRNVIVGGIQSLTVNPNNGQSGSESQTINCTKLSTLAASPNSFQTGASQLTTGELQTMTGTISASSPIGTIQVARSVQNLPTASVHLVGSCTSNPTVTISSRTATLNSIPVNATICTATTADGVLNKGQKIVRLTNNPEVTSQNIGLPMSTLSALLSGSPVVDGTITSSAKNSLNLAERINSSAAVSTGHTITATPANVSYNLNNASTGNLDVQNVQNVQVSIPGMAVPITLALNVGDQGSNSYLDALSKNAQVGTSLSNVVGTSTVILATSNTGNSMKTANLRPVMSTATIANVSGTVQQLQLIAPIQKTKPNAQVSKPVGARSLLNTNRMRLTSPSPNAVVQGGSDRQVLSVTAQQQLQLALQKQAAQLQLHQGLTAIGGLKIAQKRRRSSVTTDGS